jgi:hypothetical protein
VEHGRRYTLVGLSLLYEHLHYNLCRVHETLRVTPAMALGVTDHLWSIAELIDAAQSAPVALISHVNKLMPKFPRAIDKRGQHALPFKEWKE